MRMFMLALCMTAMISCVIGQRPFFAGSKPIGFPELYDRPTTEGLGNRFGESNGTTPRLPLEAQGDRELVDRLSKLPIDQQPFWLINWQALEANRQKPQTYPQKPNSFVDNINPNGNQNSGNIPVNNQNNVPNRNNFNGAQNLNNRFNIPTDNSNNFNTPQITNPNTPPSKTNTNNNNNNGNLNNKQKPVLAKTAAGSVTQATKPSKVTVTSKPNPKVTQKDNTKNSDYSDEYGSVEDFSVEIENPGKPKLDKFVALI